MDSNLVLISFIILIIVIAYLLGRLQHRKNSDIPQDFIDLYRQVEGLPVRVLQTIQGSINPQKGKMAELLTYAELRYDYDRILAVLCNSFSYGKFFFHFVSDIFITILLQ